MGIEYQSQSGFVVWLTCLGAAQCAIGTMKTLSHFDSLQDALADWQAPDVTAYYLARCLGVLHRELSPAKFRKVVFTSNPVSSMLFQTLDHLVKLGALECNEREQRFRWNPSFKADAICAARQLCRRGS
jgi:hypothetical protein